FTFSFTTVTALNAGTVINTVSVAGHDDEGTTASAQDSDTLIVTNVDPSIKVVKDGPTTLPEGQTATYSFTITNTSTASTDPVTITSVIDDVLGDLTKAAEDANGGNPIVLQQNQSFTFDFTTGVLNGGTVVNTVTVSAHDDENIPTSASDTHTLDVS